MRLIYYFIVGIAVLIASGCKDKCKDPTDPDCPNYNPCHDFEPASAEFKMLDIPTPTYNWSCDGQPPRNLEFEVDTIFGIDTEITFRALHQADKYEWRVGSDARVWTTKEFALTFGPEAIGQIQVQLITEKRAMPRCGGTEFTRDTLTRNLIVKGLPDNPYVNGWSLIFGKWQGFNEDSPAAIFDLEITPGFPFCRLDGLFPACVNKPLHVGIDLRYMYIVKEYVAECRNVCGLGFLQPDNRTLIIDYYYEEPPGPSGQRVKKKFVGTKVM